MKRYLILFTLFSASLWAQPDTGVVVRKVEPIVSPEPIRILPPSHRLISIDVFAYHVLSAHSLHKQVNLSKDTLNRDLAFNLSERLRQSSALFVKAYGANGIATLNVRGTGAGHTKMYWNGIDISPPGLGLMDLSLMDSDPNETFSLSYGAGALPLSSGNIGGGLSLHSKLYFRQPLQTSVQLGVGSFGREQYRFSTKYSNHAWGTQTSFSYAGAENDFRFRLPGEERRDRRMSNSDIAQMHLKQNLFWRVNKTNFLGLKAWYNSTDRLLPKISIASAAQADRMEDENLYLSADWQRSLSPKGDRIQWIAGYVNSSNRFFFQDGPVPNRNDYQSLQSSFKYVFPNLRYPTGGTKLKSEVMLQNRYDLVSSGAFSAEQSRLTNALYANVQYSSSSALEWGLQMRAERFDQDLAPLTGSLSAKYSLRPEQFLHINLSRNYRLPGLNDLYWNPGGNPDLLPEQANSAELGYSHTWAKDDQITREEYKIEASLFAMDINNWIQWAPRNGIWEAQNFKRVVNAGAELAAEASLKIYGIPLSGRFSYQYIRSRNLESEVIDHIDNDLPFNPAHSFNYQIKGSYKRWGISYQGNFSDRYFLDDANLYYLPSYFIQDLRLSYKTKWLNNHFKVMMGLGNLANRDYQIIAWRPEPGINYQIALQWQWFKG